ncbi:cardiolipin synthase [Enterococcus timonensis]|uniref:cardiolipin synthase n=1 Tax=Enterococcus timonensis TaxID=1852364 RepID=UPI0008DB217C|nr:cardiolipin synthase [Enterococcus timonensis]
MQYILEIFIFLLFINTVASVVTVFRKPRSIQSVLAWMIALVFLPGIGFILYAFCGRGIDQESILKLTPEDVHDIELIELKVEQDALDFSGWVIPPLDSNGQKLVRYLDKTQQSPFTQGNEVELFTDGKKKFDGLIADILNAKETIHIEYYSIYNDRLGNRVMTALVQMAAKGVKVRLIYDPWGSKGANKRWFKPLITLGGEVAPFVTSKNILLKSRLNYHLHRKIVVIDGKISWTGGFNIADQYIGENSKFGYWRDSHARIVGPASFTLQEIFIRDWNASCEKQQMIHYQDHFFQLPEKSQRGPYSMQIVSDGPDSFEDILKGAIIRMSSDSERRIWIQTPYLIPDDSMITTLLIAARSDIDVRIMIPQMPDHPFIYRATQYYANYLTRLGVKIYIYNNGFLHSKTCMVDDNLSSIGSMNQDIRSYSLNFEVQAFIYSEELNHQFEQIFLADMENCTLLTEEMIQNQSRWLRFKQNFSRLLSPIL